MPHMNTWNQGQFNEKKHFIQKLFGKKEKQFTVAWVTGFTFVLKLFPGHSESIELHRQINSQGENVQ